MTLPDQEVLNAIIARVFQIDDVTLGDPQKTFAVRYRGHLLVDSENAFNQMVVSLSPIGITPLFRKDGKGGHLIFLTLKAPQIRSSRISINVILFILTVFSVMLAGAQPEGPLPADPLGQLWALAASIFTGWPFALSLLTILLAHEFGHYLVSRFHRTNASLPYFLPFPFSPLGTMGAFIQMKEPVRNKRVLFDIGIAGPFAGLIVAIPVLFIGLSLSSLGSIERGPGMFIEGNSLMYLLAKFLAFGKLLPSPLNTGGLPLPLYWLKFFFTGQPFPLGGTDVFIHPVAFAGWAGLLVTALNLIPAGTLDGGHILFSLFGDRTRKFYPFIMVILVGLGFVWSGWWLWAAMLFLLGRVYAEPLDQITPLDPTRKVLAVLALVIFVLAFTPVPFIS